MSNYKAPIIFDSIFNLSNFITTFSYNAYTNMENLFGKLNTFLEDVIIHKTLTVQNININGMLLDNPYYFFTNIKHRLLLEVQGY